MVFNIKLFSITQISPDIGIKIPNLLFMMAAVFLLIFKSPFPNIIKYTIPFTFYIFYQYSIINRPYSILCFALFLIATNYKKRHSNPFIYSIGIIVLALSTIYGFAIAIGITIAYVIELLKEKQILNKNFYKDKRVIAIFIMSIIGILEFINIYPVKDSNKYFTELLYGTSFLSYKNYLLSGFYSFTGLTADATFLDKYIDIINIITSYETKDFLNLFGNADKTNIIRFIGICTIGLLINIFILFKCKRFNVLTIFVIPYILLSIAYTLHFAPHHIGLLFLFFIFIYWCGISSNQLKISPIEKIVTYFLITLVIITQLYWSFKSTINEIQYKTSPAKEIAEFIKTNNLVSYKIMGQWLNYSAFQDTKNKYYKIYATLRG